MAIVDRVDGNLSGKWDDVENKWVSPPTFTELPRKKNFSVGAVYRAFDGESYADKKAFADSPLVRLMIGGRQEITLSKDVIDYTLQDLQGIKDEGVLKQAPYDKLVTLLNSWKAELSD